MYSRTICVDTWDKSFSCHEHLLDPWCVLHLPLWTIRTALPKHLPHRRSLQRNSGPRGTWKVAGNSKSMSSSWSPRNLGFSFYLLITSKGGAEWCTCNYSSMRHRVKVTHFCTFLLVAVKYALHCGGFNWSRAIFLHSGWYGAMFWIGATQGW